MPTLMLLSSSNKVVEQKARGKSFTADTESTKTSLRAVIRVVIPMST